MARRGYSLLFSCGVFISDILAISISFAFVFWARFHAYSWIPFMPEPLEVPLFISYAYSMPLIWLVVLFCFRGGGLYRESLSFSKIVRVGSIIRQVFNTVLILMALSSFYRDVTFSRTFAVLLFPAFCVSISLGRWLLICMDTWIRKKQGKKRYVLLVGLGKPGQNLAKMFLSDKLPNYDLLGFIQTNGGADESFIEENKIEKLGHLENAKEIITRLKPDEVIFSMKHLDQESIVNLVSLCDQLLIQFYIIPDMLNMLTSRVELTSLGGINLLGVEKFPLDNGLNRSIKRILDIFGSIFGLILLSPLFIFLVYLVKRSSPGPILYRQVRCNEDGAEFTMYKFRTMPVGSEQSSGPVWASKEDDRATSIGRFMRSKNLDELPQLLNVLKGDMSLVGPRPERPHFISQFKSDIPRYMSRHHIRPGMTGWAQVNGWRGNTSLDERIKYDIYYIENWGVWFDIKIIFMTFFSFKNAY